MYYSIYATDNANSLELRLQVREAHLQRLHLLVEQGRLLTAGPHPAIDSPEPGQAGFSGSLIVAEFDSLEQAQEWANADPYLAIGAYAKIEIKPFHKVLP